LGGSNGGHFQFDWVLVGISQLDQVVSYIWGHPIQGFECVGDNYNGVVGDSELFIDKGKKPK